MSKEVILIGSPGLGKGDDTLGNLIMANFLRLLGEQETKPKYLIFWNTGVLLLTQDSQSFAHLLKLESAGVQIIACGTCCEYLDVVDRIAVGSIGNMAQIQEILLSQSVLTV